ncbi:MAG: hypothetical protein R2843_09805 [Thermomicrobiales bacterium]
MNVPSDPMGQFATASDVGTTHGSFADVTGGTAVGGIGSTVTAGSDGTTIG